MQQKFRMFLYIIRPIGIRVKICDYVNQNTAHSRGIDLSERTVLEMSVITKAGLLALAAVLLLPSAQTTQAAQPEPLIVIVQKRQDAQERTLRVLRDGSVEEAALDTYLAQVVLSEMPASFAPEALKAQAVAARTFACRQTAGGKHENADVCAQSACCQACLTVEDLRVRYGDGFEAAWDKALAAVRETQNEVLTYEGALIDAVYFSCSGGSTEDAAAVWGTDVPYLRAVESPGEQDAAKYESRVCVTAETFAETLRALDASVQLSGDPSGWVQSVTAILIVFIIAFLFTTVAANAIAIVGTNPVSGMTLMTLILSSLVLVSVGLSGTTGMTAALVIGGVVCTALSMAGGFITDLKIGYWLGTTPRKQEAWKFLGTFVAAATVAGVMIILNKSYGFVGEGALVAPQANAMAAVIQPLMTGGQTPWMLYFCGAALALVLTSIGVPALAFALGMFIPMELNAPLVVGGLVAWFVSGRSKDEGLNKARFDRGTLIASGFIAGGALMGVVSAVLKFVGVDWFLSGWASSNAAEWTGLAMYLVLIGYFAWHTLRAKKEE